MILFKNVKMEYARGEWELEVREKQTHHAAKADTEYKYSREYHGILHRALPAVRRYLTDEKDIKRYKHLYQMLAISCRIFRDADTYSFKDKIQYSVPCLAGEHHVQTNKSAGAVRLTQCILTDHHLSKGGFTTISSDPGRHRQACDIMLSTDAGEIFKKNPGITFSEYCQYLEERIITIQKALSYPSPADYSRTETDEEAEDLSEVSESS